MRNNLAYSALNYFGESNLDRVHLLRKDEAWIAARLQDPETILVPFQGMKPLLTAENQLQLVRLAQVQLQNLAQPPILLGLRHDKAYFAIDVTNAPEVPLAGGVYQELREATLQLARPDSGLLAYAKAILYWNRQNQFCSVCGSPTLFSEAGHVRKCSNPVCNTSHFPRTDTAVITMITCGDKGLLARQASWPAGMYASIAGFLEPGETLESAVAREVLEETGLKVHHVQYHSSQPWPFPASIMVGFIAEAESPDLIIDPQEIDDARWFTREEVKELVAAGELSLPPALSISYRLIQDWLNG
ncbi:NAD(+) diphosphatase [Rufibacter roseus]|uniref:NAD(+) diphosphatase n=1 Tax=Rufibacter roseus TaxID=1567108 RepID=A0ABW2DML2_9BACT|nr:NAD(+) diphosphatase [Rufibacter roseus]